MSTIELCAGAGGMAWGLKKAGHNVKLLVDSDPTCCNTLRKNFPGTKVVCDDVKNIDFTSYKNINLISAGFPCQPYSLAGNRKGMKDCRGKVIEDIFNVIKVTFPNYVLLENVPGLLSLDNNHYIEYINDTLKNLGYKHVDINVFNAMEFGVPQKRKRLIIVASKHRKIKIASPKLPQINLKEALGNVPVSEGASYSEKKKEILKLIPPGGCWINLPTELQKEYLGNSFYSGEGKRNG